MQYRITELDTASELGLTISERDVKQTMKNFRFWMKIKKLWKEFWEEENAEEYNGDTAGMYIGGTIGTLMMVAVILYGGM